MASSERERERCVGGERDTDAWKAILVSYGRKHLPFYSQHHRYVVPAQLLIDLATMLPGYARVVLALVSFYFMPTHLWLAGSTYLLSGFLDAFDGWAARKFSQGTMFGAVLDMVTDR